MSSAALSGRNGSQPSASPKQKAHAPRQSPRKRNATTTVDPATTPSHHASKGQSVKKSKNKPPTTPSAAAVHTEEDDTAFFEANEWTIFGQAHTMMEKLVKSEGPYRQKLLCLAQHSIDSSGGNSAQLTSSGVLDAAWSGVSYYWADPSTDRNLTNDGACAYTSMRSSGDAHFPVIGISSSFKGNDSPSTVQPESPGTLAMMNTDDKKTLLFFFRKIKHEFLNVVHRYLAITQKKEFQLVGTPEKYTPYKQNDPRQPAPDVGDHDEEEDTGAPVLPRFFNQPLSSANPLCLQFNTQYLKLNDEQVEGLLTLDLYSVPVQDYAHHWGRWSVDKCRAVTKGILTADFYFADAVTNDSSPFRAVSNATSRASSPAEGFETDDIPYLAAWRRNGNNPIQMSAAVFARLRPNQLQQIQEHSRGF